MAKRIIGKIQTPVSEGERTDIHYITASDAVIMDVEAEHPETMKDFIDRTGVGINYSEEQPTKSCIWAKTKSVETIDVPDPV